MTQTQIFVFPQNRKGHISESQESVLVPECTTFDVPRRNKIIITLRWSAEKTSILVLPTYFFCFFRPALLPLRALDALWFLIVVSTFILLFSSIFLFSPLLSGWKVRFLFFPDSLDWILENFRADESPSFLEPCNLPSAPIDVSYPPEWGEPSLFFNLLLYPRPLTSFWLAEASSFAMLLSLEVLFRRFWKVKHVHFTKQHSHLHKSCAAG